MGVYVEAQTSSGDVNASGFRLDGDACVNAAYEESDMTFSTDLIGAQELKEKLDRGDTHVALEVHAILGMKWP